jgi:membrane-associated phospholipid phosphatase
MHAGWALWVALAVTHVSRRRVVVALAWTHAVVTGVVVVGTGNHWVLDVVAGWAVVLIAWRTLGPQQDPLSPRRAWPAPSAPVQGRWSSTSGAARP